MSKVAHPTGSDTFVEQSVVGPADGEDVLGGVLGAVVGVREGDNDGEVVDGELEGASVADGAFVGDNVGARVHMPHANGHRRSTCSPNAVSVHTSGRISKLQRLLSSE